MNRNLARSLAVTVACAAAGPALADDLTPPPWRFSAGTTVQHWDFSSGPTGVAPDALPLNNIYGSPFMGSSGAAWLPSFGGRSDVWDLAGGALHFDIPNTGVLTHQKELWLQVTFAIGPASPFPPAYSVAGPTGLFTPIGGFITMLGNGWAHQLTQWAIPNCPPFERVTIQPAIPAIQLVIDQVVIDTRCIVPTPGTASLLALSCLCALRRRRA